MPSCLVQSVVVESPCVDPTKVTVCVWWIDTDRVDVYESAVYTEEARTPLDLLTGYAHSGEVLSLDGMRELLQWLRSDLHVEDEDEE